MDRIDLTYESATLPLTLKVDGEVRDLTLTDIPFGVYRKFSNLGGEEKIEAFIDYALAILNSNLEGVEFGREYVEAFGITKLRQLCTAYTSWLGDVINAKN